MTRTLETQTPRRGRQIPLQHAVATAAVALTLIAARDAHSQQALGVPFVGKNHLSFSVTELSRDGVGSEKAAVFGGVYGRRFNSDAAPVQISLIVRAAARALDGTEDGIAQAGLTLAATRRIRTLDGLSITGAAGLNAVVWGQDGPSPAEPDHGRVIARIPLTTGLAYDMKVGRARIAPFVSLNGAYWRERDYINSARVAEGTGWRLGHTTGVSVRFRETVLSVSGVNREGGTPTRHRVAFMAGMSW
jgi:hypothetical protein